MVVYGRIFNKKGTGSCFYPMTTHRNEINGCWETAQFPTPLFSSGLDTSRGIKAQIKVMAELTKLVRIDSADIPFHSNINDYSVSMPLLCVLNVSNRDEHGLR